MQAETEAGGEERAEDGADASFWEPALPSLRRDAGGEGGGAEFVASRGLSAAEAEALLRQ